MKYVEENRTKLLGIATQKVMNSWRRSIVDGEIRWTWNHHEDILTESQFQNLKKALEKRTHEKITPDFLKEVSVIYEEAVRDGLRPAQQVAEHFQRSKDTAQRWATAARKFGFLAQTTQGKVSSVKSINETNRKRVVTNKADVARKASGKTKSDTSKAAKKGAVARGNQT